MPHAYTYDLDLFYAAEEGKIESAERPRSKRPAEITVLVKEIEASGQPGFTDVCVTLLNMDASSAAKIAREFRQIVNRFRATEREIAFSVTSKVLGVGVTVAIRDGWTAQAMEALRTRDKRKGRAARWVTILLRWVENERRFQTFIDEQIEVSLPSWQKSRV